jgi:hypothetical protein
MLQTQTNFSESSAWSEVYATSQELQRMNANMGSIPIEFIKFFNTPNASNCTTTLESTKPLTELSMSAMSVRGIMDINSCTWC